MASAEKTNRLLGDLLRHARQSRGLSVAELAEQCGVSAATIRDYEGGRISSPGPLAQLGELLDLPLALLESLRGPKGLRAARETKGEIIADPVDPSWKWYAWDEAEAADWLAGEGASAEAIETLPNFFAAIQTEAGEAELREQWVGPETAADGEESGARPVLLVLFGDGDRVGDVQAYKFYHGRADLEGAAEAEAEETEAAALSVTPATAIARIQGYGNVYDVLDLQGEVVRRGAFARASEAPYFWDHSYVLSDQTIPVGHARVHEDAYGLFFDALIADVQAGRDLIAVMQLRDAMKAAQLQASVGFQRVEGGQRLLDDGTTELLDSELLEISSVVWPANQATETWLVGAGAEGERAAVARRLAAAAIGAMHHVR